MNELENKYISLLLDRCLSFNNTKSLLIHIDLKELMPFANLIKSIATSKGIDDIYININDIDELHDYLQNTEINDIECNELISRYKWDEYAKKGASILIISSVVPGLMDDIDPSKIKKVNDLKEETFKYYRANVTIDVFPWCIAAYPNKRWAQSIYHTDDSYDLLFKDIMKLCFIDKNDPIEEWSKYIEKTNYYKNKLNELKIKSLHYTNSLGTDITVGIPSDNYWYNIDSKDSNGNKIIVNMPSYEVFTTPNRNEIDGIVYSSKPLLYNGCLIEDFWIKFRNGRVEKAEAKKGNEVLQELIFKNNNVDSLGEIALVPYDSPISNTNIVFKSTLFDENASCHMALGHGFENCFKDYDKYTKDELIKKGFNDSPIHVDFMMGTNDLQIDAITENGKVNIFKDGNFNI